MSGTTPLPTSLAEEVRRTLHDLRSVRLASQAWAVLAGDVARLDAAVARGDETAVRAALIPVSQAAFEGKVQGRLAGTGTHVPAVVPTKRSALLPVVGLVCGALILAAGYLIGGPLVLLGSGALALFVLVVAVAGSRVASSRSGANQQSRLAPTAEPVYPPPSVLRDALQRIEDELDP
jgi:hypothetical protein